MTPTILVGYLALFVAVGFLFLLVNLLVGWLVRPREPNPEKLDIYECGEPTIGSSFVQFDLRFYVVALLFLIFDVEVAFFFPWANVYGTAIQLSGLSETGGAVAGGGVSEEASFLYERLGAAAPEAGNVAQVVSDTASTLSVLAMCDIGVFFAVLMVGFAYVWSQGDIDWVRTTIAQRRREPRRRKPPIALGESRGATSVLSS